MHPFKNKKIIQTHLLFWGVFVLFGVVFNVASHNQMQLNWELFWSDLTDPLTSIGYGRTILMCYLSLWIFDRLFQWRQYGLAVLTLMGLIALDVLLRYVIEQRFLGPVFGIWQYPASMQLWTYFGENVFFSALGIFLCFVLKTINDFFRNEAIRNEKVSMELVYLKSQLNPHFLFNTMNNLYGLSLTEPERTPEVVLRLGEMMRYMLYESNAKFVLLSREIDYLNGFIELEKLRYPHDINVQFTVEGDINSVYISPLLLICFVENVFKHGDLRSPQHFITIHLRLLDKILHFETNNLISLHNHDTEGGIGLKNVVRRLSLLYPDKHTLKIYQKAEQFRVDLEIDLQIDANFNVRSETT